MGTIIRRIFRSLRKVFIFLLARVIFRLEGIEGVSHYVKLLRFPETILRAFGATIGDGTYVYPGIEIHAAQKDFSNLVIGCDCRIGRGCFFDLTEKITVQDRANIGMRSTLITHVNVAFSGLKDHGLQATSSSITIGADSVLFAATVILKGVTIGDNAIVSAGSLVSVDVPSWTVVAGNPARIIKKIPREDKIKE